MPPRKRARGEFAAVDACTLGRSPLPADLLLEIVARSDAATLVRCAASCRSLRRDIRRPAFIRRVCHDGPNAIVPPRLLGFLFLGHEYVRGVPRLPPCFSLVHPATPAAASLAETCLVPSLRRSGADAGRLVGYHALTSRNGLVLLRRTWSEMMMCVYDPMAGKGTFFPGPPDATGDRGFEDGYDCEYDKYVLLTPADGIVGCSFLVLFADFSGLLDGSRAVMVRTSNGGTWSPATYASHSREPRHAAREPCDNVAVLRGGFIHWLIRSGEEEEEEEDGEEDYYIFTYNFLTAAAGWIELPAEVPAKCRDVGKLHLTSSRDGKRLSLLVADKFKVSVWMLLSAGDDDGACSSWARHAVIDTGRTVYYDTVKWSRRPWPTSVDIVGSGARNGAVILLPSADASWSWSEFDEVAQDGLVALDLETKEMLVVSKGKHAFVYEYEIDMASRLSAMKNF